MGNSDTLEIKHALQEPPRLVLYSYRRGVEIICPVEDRCSANLAEILQEPSASFWLRYVSHTLVPFFVLWHRSDDFALVVRVKHGSSRRDVSIPCSEASGRRLLALSRDWKSPRLNSLHYCENRLPS